MSNMKFEFSSHSVNVEIAGETYAADCSTEAQAFIRAQNEKAKSVIEAIKQGEQDAQAAIAVYKTTLDRVLGDGAIDRIFAGREMSADDVVDLALFIRDVYVKYNEDTQRRIAGTSKKKK